MNEEIKKILEEMKEICDVWVKVDGDMKAYTQEQINCIYDYITNLQQELQSKDNIINEVKDILNRMIYMGYCAKTGEGTTATNFMATGENSEFGTRAKYVLDKIKELEENK